MKISESCHWAKFLIRSDGIIENFLLRQGTESSRCNSFLILSGSRGHFRSGSVGRLVGSRVDPKSVGLLPFLPGGKGCRSSGLGEGVGASCVIIGAEP